MSALEAMIPSVTTFTAHDLLYIDEIGQMELFSDAFKQLVTTYLDVPNFCLATMSAVYSDNFIEQVRRRDDIEIIELEEGDWEKVEEKIKTRLF